MKTHLETTMPDQPVTIDLRLTIKPSASDRRGDAVCTVQAGSKTLATSSGRDAEDAFDRALRAVGDLVWYDHVRLAEIEVKNAD
jgi:hypothetical protein